MLGLADLVGQAVRDARALARAELLVVRAKLMERFRRSRAGIILILVALLIAHAAVIALALGLVLSLATLVGGAVAGIIIALTGLLIAGILAAIAIRLFKPSSPAPSPSDTPA